MGLDARIPVLKVQLDQPAHTRSLISPFVIRLNIRQNNLLGMIFSETQKTDFLASMSIEYHENMSSGFRTK